jgi:FkbM family methyltransferase
MKFNCDDCGAEMDKPCLCLVMFSVLDEHSREEGFHRVSNLCERCRALKRVDAMKAYPPGQRRPVRRIKVPSGSLFGLEWLKNRRFPDAVGLSGKPLWLYGKGELGQLAQEFFRYAGVEVAGSFEHDEPAPLGAQVAVCIVRNGSYGEIQERLFARGFRDIVPFYDLADSIPTDHALKNGWLARPDKTDFDKIESVLLRWSDDASPAHYLQFLAWRILREEWVFDGVDVTKDNLFFIPEVVALLREDEVFLDGGAHHGETLTRLASLCSQARIIEVEPDNENRAEFYRLRPHDRGFVCEFALSDLDDAAPFAEGFGMCSKLTPSGKATKVTRRIDSLGISPTFIKLHLEGGDLAALRGGERTLVRCRPIVAVRVDHNSDGLWRTADYLMNLLPDYRFLFRNHCWCGSAAAVYAIPNERG